MDHNIHTEHLASVLVSNFSREPSDYYPAGLFSHASHLSGDLPYDDTGRLVTHSGVLVFLDNS